MKVVNNITKESFRIKIKIIELDYKNWNFNEVVLLSRDLIKVL